MALLQKLATRKKMDINIAVKNTIMYWQSQQQEERARGEGPSTWAIIPFRSPQAAALQTMV